MRFIKFAEPTRPFLIAAVLLAVSLLTTQSSQATFHKTFKVTGVFRTQDTIVLQADSVLCNTYYAVIPVEAAHAEAAFEVAMAAMLSGKTLWAFFGGDDCGTTDTGLIYAANKTNGAWQLKTKKGSLLTQIGLADVLPGGS